MPTARPFRRASSMQYVMCLELRDNEADCGFQAAQNNSCLVSCRFRRRVPQRPMLMDDVARCFGLRRPQVLRYIGAAIRRTVEEGPFHNIPLRIHVVHIVHGSRFCNLQCRHLYYRSHTYKMAPNLNSPVSYGFSSKTFWTN